VGLPIKVVVVPKKRGPNEVGKIANAHEELAHIANVTFLLDFFFNSGWYPLPAILDKQWFSASSTDAIKGGWFFSMQ